MIGAKGEFHMEVMEPVYQEKFMQDKGNKDMEER